MRFLSLLIFWHSHFPTRTHFPTSDCNSTSSRKGGRERIVKEAFWAKKRRKGGLCTNRQSIFFPPLKHCVLYYSIYYCCLGTVNAWWSTIYNYSYIFVLALCLSMCFESCSASSQAFSSIFYLLPMYVLYTQARPIVSQRDVSMKKASETGDLYLLLIALQPGRKWSLTLMTAAFCVATFGAPFGHRPNIDDDPLTPF